MRVRYSRRLTGTLAWRSSRKKFTNMGVPFRSASAPLPPVQERQPLQEMHVLLALQERAVQRRDELAGIFRAQGLGRDVLYHQQLQPVEQLRGRRLLLEPGHLAHLVEDVERLAH